MLIKWGVIIVIPLFNVNALVLLPLSVENSHQRINKKCSGCCWRLRSSKERNDLLQSTMLFLMMIIMMIMIMMMIVMMI